MSNEQEQSTIATGQHETMLDAEAMSEGEKESGSDEPLAPENGDAEEEEENGKDDKTVEAGVRKQIKRRHYTPGEEQISFHTSIKDIIHTISVEVQNKRYKTNIEARRRLSARKRYIESSKKKEKNGEGSSEDDSESDEDDNDSEEALVELFKESPYEKTTLRIKDEALEMMNSGANYIWDILVERIDEIARRSGKVTVMTAHLKGALQSLFPPDVADSLIKSGYTAMGTYNASYDDDSDTSTNVDTGDEEPIEKSAKKKKNEEKKKKKTQDETVPETTIVSMQKKGEKSQTEEEGEERSEKQSESVEKEPSLLKRKNLKRKQVPSNEEPAPKKRFKAPASTGRTEKGTGESLFKKKPLAATRGGGNKKKESSSVAVKNKLRTLKNQGKQPKRDQVNGKIKVGANKKAKGGEEDGDE